MHHMCRLIPAPGLSDLFPQQSVVILMFCDTVAASVDVSPISPPYS